MSHLRVFGCMAYTHVPEGERRKQHNKSKRMRFVGYSLTSKGFRLFDETNRKLYIRRDVEFNENDFGQTKVMTTKPDLKGEETKAECCHNYRRWRTRRRDEEIRRHPASTTTV